MIELLTIPDAVKRLGKGVKPTPLRRVAEENGLLIKLGATPMVEASALPKIVELCRVKKPRPGSTSERQKEGGRHGISDMKDGKPAPGLMSATAQKLKKL